MRINNEIICFKGNERETEEVLDEILVKNIGVAEGDQSIIKMFKLYYKNNNKFKYFLGEKASFSLEKSVNIKNKISYSVPPKLVDQSKLEIKRLLAEDIIEKSHSNIISPAFFIKKKNGDLKLVVDYREVNKCIRDDPWVIPNIEESIIRIGSKEYFSQIDLSNGFNQIRIEEESKELTSFFLLGQQWQYKRVPFGIKTGPKIFQRYISNLLGDIDDITFYSKTIEDHRKTLFLVLKRLYENRVKINFEKTKLFCKEINVLGYKINKEGIFPKTEYLHNKIFSKEIQTKRELQQLVGVLNWYRKFIPDMSRKLHKITDMLKNKHGKIMLDNEMKRQIIEMRKFIRENHKLSFPDYTRKFTLHCDASDIGLGSVLTQEGNIIGYYSKKFSGSELNYTIVEKEYLAIVLSMIKFKNIIQGSYVEVFTDSRNCVFENKKNTSRIARWKLIMNGYNYDIKHIDGNKNNVADALSRCYIATETESYEDQISKQLEEIRKKYCLHDTTGQLVKDRYNKIKLKNNKIK